MSEDTNYFNEEIEAKVIKAYLLESKSHRQIQKEVLNMEAPARGGGFLAMQILHNYGINPSKKGILKNSSIAEEYSGAEGNYKKALDLLKKYSLIGEKRPKSLLTNKDLINHIHSYIKSKGFYYTREEVINLYLSIKTKPFVILSGISGTGKTKIVQWFAESVGANEENGQFTLIPVRPDWNDSSDLLGYVDIKGDFKPGPLTKVIEKAEKNLDRLFYIII